MADSSVLADSMMPPEQMRLIQNFDTDTIGQLRRRKGLTRLGSAAVIADNTILGLHHHIGTNSQIIACVNEVTDATCEAYYLSGTTWTIRALTFAANTKVRMASFLDYVFAVNGTTSPASWTGAAAVAWGTTNLTSAPTGSLIEVYKQQLFIGSESTDQINFSSVPSAGAITWTAADNFLLNPNDGSKLRAMKTYGQELLLFKDKYLYRFNARAVDADPLIFFGAPSQEAVAVASGICWFYDANRQGLYGYSGGYPDWISKPVDSFFKAVPTSSKTSVTLSGSTNHVEAHLGDLTVDGITFTNTSCRYNISTQTWVIRNYSKEFRIFAPYDDGTSLFVLGGTTDGHVVKMETGNDDMGTAIDYQLETAWLTIGNDPTVEFTLASFAAFVENSSGNMEAQYRTENNSVWLSIGSCKHYATSWSGINARFHRIKFRFIGSSANDQVLFDGFSILAPLVEGVEKESMIFNP